MYDKYPKPWKPYQSDQYLLPFSYITCDTTAVTLKINKNRGIAMKPEHSLTHSGMCQQLVLAG